MIINITPPSSQSLTSKNWTGQEITLTTTLTEILAANSNRIKILIDNRTNDDCFISFGDDPDSMRIMPDNLWIEMEAAQMNLKAKGTGIIFIAEWLK